MISLGYTRTVKEIARTIEELHVEFPYPILKDIRLQRSWVSRCLSGSLLWSIQSRRELG